MSAVLVYSIVGLVIRDRKQKAPEPTPLHVRPEAERH